MKNCNSFTYFHTYILKTRSSIADTTIDQYNKMNVSLSSLMNGSCRVPFDGYGYLFQNYVQSLQYWLRNSTTQTYI